MGNFLYMLLRAEGHPQTPPHGWSDSARTDSTQDHLTAILLTCRVTPCLYLPLHRRPSVRQVGVRRAVTRAPSPPLPTPLAQRRPGHSPRHSCPPPDCARPAPRARHQCTRGAPVRRTFCARCTCSHDTADPEEGKRTPRSDIVLKTTNRGASENKTQSSIRQVMPGYTEQ